MFGSKESDSTNPENKKLPTLDFDGKKYDINSLPDDVKDLLKGLQVADTQIRMHKDTLRLLDLGKNSLGAQLKQKLENISPLEN
ncbi:DUF6447 family protein [Prochlorococcus sp. AH-716-A06]|nr:DUF6447 family protein [Prochlorococcus sp. AH-716-A06]